MQPALRPSSTDSLGNEWINRFESSLVKSATGSLQGLRFAVKDNIDVESFPTTAGCPAFSKAPQKSAEVVTALLNAGAAMVGKTNLDQFACGLNGTRSPFGVVPNTFNPAYVCGGSSSGSASVVATGQVDFSLGTDTAGSGRVPAGLNNIVGLKPSKGLISTQGVLPAAQSVDCVSIFATTVATAVRVLDVASGYDAADPYSLKLQLKRTPFPSQFRFGIPDQLEFYGDSLAKEAFEHSQKRMVELGGTAVTIPYAPLAQAAAMLYDSALVAERYAAIRDFFDTHEHEVIEPVRSIIAKGRNFGAADVFESQCELRRLGQAAKAMWDHIDFLLVPTAPTHYTIAQMQADPVVLNRHLGHYTNFVNLLDYAALSVPSEIRPDGLPFGVTLVGVSGSDWQLAELGQRYHHATGLSQGATGKPLPAPERIPGLIEVPTMPIAVVGAHLSGMPLNNQLIERGAALLRTTTTSAQYRLFALLGTTPPKPGLKRVQVGGVALEVEVWQVPIASVGSFLSLIPAPLGLGKLELMDGSWVTGFVCEEHALAHAQDISSFAGWRSYVKNSASHNSSTQPEKNHV